MSDLARGSRVSGRIHIKCEKNVNLREQFLEIYNYLSNDKRYIFLNEPGEAKAVLQ